MNSNLRFLFLCASTLIVSFSNSGPSKGSEYAGEPLVSIQSPGLLRFLEVSDSIGIPDPVASSGMATSATLELMKTSIELNRTCGAHIYLTDERPVIAICLPLRNLNSFLESISSFGGAKFTKESDDIYRIIDAKENESKAMYMKVVGDQIVLCDSRMHTAMASRVVAEQELSSSKSDVSIQIQLGKLLQEQRNFLKKEFVSLTLTKPTTNLQLSPSSLREYFTTSMQRYMIDSLFDAKEMDIQLVRLSDGGIDIKIDTTEIKGVDPFKSAFQWTEVNGESFAIDFASIVSKETRDSVHQWLKATEGDWTATVTDPKIENRSEAPVLVETIHWIADVARTSVDQGKFDGFAAIGSLRTDSYLAGGILVQDSESLAKRWNNLSNRLRSVGLSFQDLRKGSNDSIVDMIIDFPLPLESLGIDAEDSKLHLKMRDNKLGLSIGSSGVEKLNRAMDGSTSTSIEVDRLVSLSIDWNAVEGISGSGSTSPIPFGAKGMQMTIDRSEKGRTYRAHFEKAPTTSINQVSKN